MVNNNLYQNDDCDHLKSYWLIYIAGLIFIIVGVLAYNAGIDALESDSTKVENKITLIVGFLVYIGVIVSFIGVIFQNRYRINIEVLSKNRQEWINDLRKQVAFFNSSVESVIRGLRDNYQDGDVNAMVVIEAKRADLSDSYYIRLLLSATQQKEGSSGKRNSDDLIKKLASLKETVDSCSGLSLGRYEKIIKCIDKRKIEICNTTEKILKEEWVRVKRGV